MSYIKKYWLEICSILAIGIFGFLLYKSFVGYMNPAEGIGRTTGRSTIYALIIFFAANFLRKRWGRKKLEFWIFCFAVSFSVCATYDLIKTNINTYQLNNAKQELARLFKDLDKGALSPVNEYSEVQYGDFANVFIVLKDSFKLSENLTAEINEACTDLENIINPEALCEYENIIQAKNTVAAFAEKLNLCEKKYDESLALTQFRFNEVLSGNENLKRHFLKGFEEGKKTSNELMNEFFDIEKKSAQKIDDVLTFLSTKSGTFMWSDGTFIFDTDEDVDMFNQLVQTLSELGQKEELIIEKLEGYRQSVLQGLGKL